MAYWARGREEKKEVGGWVTGNSRWATKLAACPQAEVLMLMLTPDSTPSRARLVLPVDCEADLRVLCIVYSINLICP